MRIIISLLILALCGCGEHRQTVANAAASVWEAADAIEKGVPPAKPCAAIKALASAIADAEVHPYPAKPTEEAP